MTRDERDLDQAVSASPVCCAALCSISRLRRCDRCRCRVECVYPIRGARDETHTACLQYKPSSPPLVRNRKLYGLAFGIEDPSSTESTESLANCGSVILYDHVRAQVWSTRANVSADVRNVSLEQLGARPSSTLTTLLVRRLLLASYWLSPNWLAC